MAILKIIVVGAGPSGLLLALLLANAGINVQVLEAASKLDESPRATHYSWPALYELKRAGILEEVRERGFVTWGGIQWRNLEGTLLARFNPDAILKDNRLHCLPLGKLCNLMKEHLDRRPNAEVKYMHRVSKIDQTEACARVWAQTPHGEQTFEADYVVGCDGASSQIRQALFGDDFPGRTWDEQIVATNVYYNIERHGWDQGAFIVDPVYWSMALQISLDGMLRVTYGEVPGLTREEYLTRQPEKFRTILPGHPSPEDYKIVNFSPYKIHQRCAKSFRVGRFLLAADAAHLCNPFGGLGLTGGIVDVGNLFDCLNGIHQGLADENILDRYNQVRREKYFEFIDPVSSANLRRLIQDPEVAMKEDSFFKMAKDFEDAEFCARLGLGVNAIMHDFTQEYRKAGEALPENLQSKT
ncbi:uncharacterized protein A1O9_03086 [Exophiala aquamarina CBS 119918]|uniref:FAD-binding domain-containing protein n=1 Tax=Exophiala aquamarina CBS 119918 TaxID=1182545 RepID=A0A072PN47_9EURO|nr:uncharacterized protein A1O9_03086 [Exophiala aquamarina CBS 119918]KEF61519.1 hypothetical protein A1O9_03086 [Exophiala aquamarina CBS 119918]